MLSIRRLISKLGFLLPVFILIVFEIILFKANYKSGTWLVGWDSTMPELNLKVNFFRELNATWQEYRGLGLLDGMAHASNLMHTIYISLLSLVFPSNFVRYFFIFLMHFLGGTGAYFLARYFLRKEDPYSSSVLPLVAALFYLFNPVAIQMFFTPLETFVIHFGFLPWLFLVLLRFIDEGGPKWAFVLFTVNLLAVSQSHVPTIFIVYALGFFIISVSRLFGKPKNWKRIIVGFSILMAVNAFWIAPYIYSAILNAPVISNSKINELSNEEIVLMNKDYGNVKSTILLRGFSLDYGDWDKSMKNFDFQLKSWREYWFSGNFETIGYVLFTLSLIGVLYSFFVRKGTFPFFLIFIFSFLNLVTDSGYFSIVKNFLDNSIPYYKEVFRFTFTKFAVSYTLVLSVFLAMGLLAFNRLLRKYLGTLFAIFIAVAIIYLSKPAFAGNFFYDNLRLDIPNEYFSVFQYFDGTRNDGRVAILPLNSLWNWEYEKWGYRGSGFVWQSIGNSVLHRSFDPWSSFNETFYNEVSYALYAGDSEAFARVLQKYQVKYLLLDESIINAGGSPEVLFIPEIKDMLFKLGIEEVFKSGFLTVYDTGVNADNISAPNTYTMVNVDLDYSQVDPIYSRYGDYIQNNNALGYPFVNFDHRGPVNISLSSSLNDLIFENKSTGSEVILPVEGKIEEAFGKGRGFSEAYNCDLKKIGRVEKEGTTYRAFDGGVSCDFFDYPDLKHNQAYVLRIKGENKEGRSLKIYLQNWETNRMDLEELMPTGTFDEYYFVYPESSSGSGYSLNLETRSFGRIASENTVSAIGFYPVDIKFLSEVYTGESEKVIENNLRTKGVKKYGTAIYKVDVDLPASATPKALQAGGEGLMQLGQGFEKGWMAFQGNTKLEHVKVNSWSNGWLVPPGASVVYIVFWPQLLEWGGMILGLMVLVGMLTKLRS